MAACVYYGRLTIPIAAGVQTVTGIVDIDGATAFTPKGIVFWSSKVPSPSGFTDQGYFTVGMTDGTTQVTRAFMANKDNLTPTSAARGFSAEAYSESRCIWIRKYASGLPPAAVVFTDLAASIGALASGQFQLTWSSVDTNQDLVHFMCWGGSDVTMKCGVFTAPAVSGAQSQTVTGVGFEPIGLITINPLTTSTSYMSTGLGLDGSRMSGFGWASNALVNQTTGGYTTGAFPATATYRTMWRDACWAERRMHSGTGNPLGIAGSIQAVASDGFTVSWSTLLDAFRGVRVPYLAFTGMVGLIGRTFQPLAPATLGIPSTVLTAALFQGAGYPASASLNENPPPQPLRLCVGGLTARAANNQGCAFIGDESGVATTVSVRGLSTTTCFLSATPAATGSASVVYAQAEGDMATGLELDWTAANASANEVFMIVFADADSIPPDPPPDPDFPPFPPVPPPVPVGTVRPIRRVRRFPLPYRMNYYLFISRLEVIIQAGVGLTSGQGVDPQIMMRLSRDGGKTWGNEIDMSMGALGEYAWRSYANKLGRGRNWVCELAVSDPVFVSLIECNIDAEWGNS